MNENTTNMKNSTTAPGSLERCAELATWHQLETDPVQKEHLAAALAQCVREAAKSEAEKKAELEAKEKAEAEKKADADKAEKTEKAAKTEKQEQEDKAKEEAKAQAKAQARAAEAAEHAEWEKGMLERAERSASPEAIRERTIEVPENIRNNPMYQQILQDQRAAQAQIVAEHAGRVEAEMKAAMYQGLVNQARIEASELRNEQKQPGQDAPGMEAPAVSDYEKAAEELDARPLKEGDEIEGEIVEVAEVNGKNYYVLEQDGERIAVPAGERPDHETGDEITASHTKEGFETGESHDYGR